MAWLAVSKAGTEIISSVKPLRDGAWWDCSEEICMEGETGYVDMSIELPKGSIKKLIGRDLTWSDEPVELKEE